MAETHVMVGKYWVQGIQGSGTNASAIVAFPLTGTLSPNLQTARVTHAVPKQEVFDSQGRKIGMMFADDEELAVSFDVLPEATDTTDNALLSARLPIAGEKFTLSHFPVWNIGSFTDAFNSANWYYGGGGAPNLQSKEAATLTFELHRYKNITAVRVPAPA